ncbi:hypothetical protein BGM24_27685 [Bacillus sp. FJAT-26377]|nr:hypothetical protein [Bacillus sp. FJAT-26377]
MYKSSKNRFTRVLMLSFIAIVSLCVVLPSTIAKADIPTYYPVPEPKGDWKLDQTFYYKTANTSDAKAFSGAVASFLAAKKIKGTTYGALAAGVSAVYARNIKDKTVWITAKAYTKENYYIKRTKMVYTSYKDAKRTQKIKTSSRESYFIKHDPR